MFEIVEITGGASYYVLIFANNTDAGKIIAKLKI